MKQKIEKILGAVMEKIPQNRTITSLISKDTLCFGNGSPKLEKLMSDLSDIQRLARWIDRQKRVNTRDP